MGFDRDRPVPWRRLVRDAVMFLVAGTVILAVFLDERAVGSYVGLLAGLGIYITFAAVLAKFGYQRQTLAELRAASRAQAATKQAQRGGSSPPGGRPKPAPTKRTGGGGRRR